MLRLKMLMRAIAVSFSAGQLAASAVPLQSQPPQANAVIRSGSGDADQVAAKLRWAVTDVEQIRDEKHLKLQCQTRIEQTIVSFLSLGDATTLIAAFTDRALKNPTKDVWLQQYFLEQGGTLTAGSYDLRRPSATANWAYVYDQDGDGRIDHLAFLIGPLNIEPPNPPDDLPKAAPDRSFHNVEGSQLKKWFRWINKFSFWQAIDDNADGKIDWIATPARKKVNGWIRGWAVIPWTGEASTPGCQILDGEGAWLEPCYAMNHRDYDSSSRTAHLWTSDPQSALTEALRGAQACNLGRHQLRRMRPLTM